MQNNKYYLGIDIGSISLKTVVLNEAGDVLKTFYQRSDGQPIKRLREALNELGDEITNNIAGVGVTGSGRSLANIYIGADLVIDEITAQATAVLRHYPDTKTIVEIGGQDSKIIVLEDGIVKNFAMNTVCAAGTGAFLDQQSNRLKIDIKDFGKIALKSKDPTPIAGRCTVFAETDMIHKQQIGISVEDILAGLCESLAKNFIHAVAKSMEISNPIIFQGGVAANQGMIQAFNRVLKTKVKVPEYYNVMPALGVAHLVKDEPPTKSKFKGSSYLDKKIERKIWRCNDCANNCELLDIVVEGEKVSTTGSVCGKHGC